MNTKYVFLFMLTVINCMAETSTDISDTTTDAFDTTEHTVRFEFPTLFGRVEKWREIQNQSVNYLEI